MFNVATARYAYFEAATYADFKTAIYANFYI